MPFLPNAVTEAKNTELIQACSYALVDFISNVLIDESPIVYPTPGYKVYQKRTLTASKILSNIDSYSQRMAILVAYCYPNIVWDIQANQNVLLSRWLIDNRVCEWDYNSAANQSTGGIGRQIFDALAEVNQGDFV